MSKDEIKLKAKVDEYFEKYMCVSFDKFIENWEQTKEFLNEERKINYMFASQCDTYRNQLQQKENIIKEVREYANTDKNCVPKHIKDYINNLLDKENKQ